MAFNYDFILKNGHIYNPAENQDYIGSIYVRNGKIVAKDERLEDTAINTIDCTGKYILPGFIEEHSHFFYDGNNNSANSDLLCPPSGVTTAVDAGTAGFANFPLYSKVMGLRSVTNFKAYLNVTPFGILDVPRILAEDVDPKTFCEDEILKIFDGYSQTLVGLKIRIDSTTCRGYGLEPVRETIRIAEQVKARGHRCIVSVHAANVPEDVDIGEIAQLLRPGDVFCHVFSPVKSSVFDQNGRVKEKIRRAQERGVYMDCCNGRIHWSFENYHKAISQNFLPDLISSDCTRVSMFSNPAFSVLNPMNALLQAGMPEKEIFKAVTYTAAKALGILEEAGTLNIGAPADIAVVDVADHEHEMRDWYGGVEQCKRMILPLLTMRKGEIVFRQYFFRAGTFSV